MKLSTTMPPAITPPTSEFRAQYDDLVRHVTTIIHQCELQRELSFSSASKDLIIATLVAITQDPSPRWRISSPQDFNLGWSKILTELPKSLDKLASLERKTGRVTYFQVLHWLGTNVDSLCPFPK